MDNETKGMLLGLMGVVAFSLTLPATRYITAFFDPVFIGLGRATLAGFVALIVLLVSKQSLPSRRQFKLLLVIASGTVLGFPVLSSWAMQTVPASHGGVVIALIPLFTAVIGSFISGERPSIQFWVLALIGASLVAVYSLLQGEMQFHLGDLLLLLASFLGALGYAVGGKLSKELGGWQVSCWVLIAALPFIMLPAVLHKPDNIEAIPSIVWLNFIYLGLISQLFGFFIWYKGLALGGISRVSQTQLLQPFFTILASVYLLGEAFDATTLLFALAVVLVVALSRKMPILHKEKSNGV